MVLTFTVGFIAREFGDVLEITRRCVASDVPCHFRPQPFMRYAVYGGIGLAQVFVVFLFGLNVEERLRRNESRREARQGLEQRKA